MKHEYHEGPKAGENFKKLATAVLQSQEQLWLRRDSRRQNLLARTRARTVPLAPSLPPGGATSLFLARQLSIGQSPSTDPGTGPVLRELDRSEMFVRMDATVLRG